MPRSLSNGELADKLQSPQVDRTLLDEAARRIREFDLRALLTIADAASAVVSNPLLDKRAAQIAETSVLGVVPRRVSSQRLSSLAGRILSGASYDHADVMSLAASVMSQDESA